MNFFSTLLISIGLAMDCFAVSLCAATIEVPQDLRFKFRIAWHFGLFQAGFALIGYFFGSGKSSGWMGMIVSARPGATPADFGLAENTMRYLVHKPPKPDWDYRTFDFDRDISMLDEWGKLADAKDPDLSKFRKRNGKLLMTYGWADAILQPMVGAGYRVVRHDHRGTGLSDWMEDWDAAQPYTLEDMAADGIAVLDDLGVGKAHVVGVSLGGMIAQQMAISFPDRVASLTSIMSSGYAQDPGLPGLSVEIATELAKLGIKYGLVGTEKNTLKMVVASQQLLMGDPPYKLDVQTIAEQVLYNLRVRRGYNPQASQQHAAATTASGSRYKDLARLEVPALIIHGTSDPMIPIVHGKKCAQTIPGARTLWVEGMGHDLPRQFVEPILSGMCQ